MQGLTDIQIAELRQRGCSADDWAQIFVTPSFVAEQLSCAHFAGRVEIGEGVKISRSYVSNYTIGEGSVIEDVTRLECRKESTFGNGVSVATVNENGGRAVKIYDELRAQTAYIWAMYRHEEAMCEAIERMVDRYTEGKRSAMGRIGKRCRIVGCGLLREVDIRDEVVIEGASKVECATVMCDAYVGVDVKMERVIAAENSRIDTGATIERCFVGECAIVASGFSAVDSLIFSSSHLENGEAASIFAGPYTVSHHKSSLLIAGIFSFFNAGSGSNQSNHLFKCGAVHQAVHSRGCKFASGAYVMAPAREGAFTMVKGSHSRHHDTSDFPFSYLIEDGGRSLLMPASNLTSYGTRRDMAKWPERDRRVRRRDVINYEDQNPYLTSAMVRAVNVIHSLEEQNPTADEYMWQRVVIRRSLMRRGLGLYNKAIAAALGRMLSVGRLIEANPQGEWVDVAGAYLPMSLLQELIDDISAGRITRLSEIDGRFYEVSQNYDNYAYSYAYTLLSQLLSSAPTEEQIASTISSAESSAEEIERQVMSDMKRDCDISMAVGYGVDSHDEAVRAADFRVVRGMQ